MPNQVNKSDQNKIAQAIENTLISPNESDQNLEAANVVDGLFALSRAISSGLKWLGNGDAATPMGAIEALGKSILDASEKIADSIDNLAEAIRESKEDQ